MASSGENSAFGGTKRINSDLSLDFLSHVWICKKLIFSLFIRQDKTIYEINVNTLYINMENIDLEKHCLILNKPGFPRLRHSSINIVLLGRYTTDPET